LADALEAAEVHVCGRAVPDASIANAEPSRW
jgi:hypothetical protein